MIQALTLISMAIQLLLVVNHPNVPDSIRQKAISIAKLAITVSNNAIAEASKPVVSASPTPLSTEPISLGISIPIITPEPMPISTPIPVSVPTPVPTPTSTLIIDANFASNPIVTFTKDYSGSDASKGIFVIDSLRFRTNKHVVCSKTQNGDIKSWGDDCLIEGALLIRTQFLGTCDVERDVRSPYQYFFRSNETHTCELILTDDKGNDFHRNFIFHTPND